MTQDPKGCTPRATFIKIPCLSYQRDQLSTQQDTDTALLVEKCRNGDTKAYRKLYDLYARAMFNTALRILNNRTDAEDVLQDAFTEAFSHLNGFGERAAFGTWLRRITVNRSINFLKKKRVPTTGLDEELVDGTKEDAPADDSVMRYRMNEIRLAIQELPDGYRTVICLHLLEGYDHEEIAQILQVSQVTVRTQYSRARKKLLHIIQKGGQHV